MEIVPFEKHVLLNTCAEVQGNERIFMIGTWKKAFRKVLELLSISSERRAMQENFLFETSGNFYSITKNSGAFPKLLPHSSVRGWNGQSPEFIFETSGISILRKVSEDYSRAIALLFRAGIMMSGDWKWALAPWKRLKSFNQRRNAKRRTVAHNRKLKKGN